MATGIFGAVFVYVIPIKQVPGDSAAVTFLMSGKGRSLVHASFEFGARQTHHPTNRSPAELPGK